MGEYRRIYFWYQTSAASRWAARSATSLRAFSKSARVPKASAYHASACNGKWMNTKDSVQRSRTISRNLINRFTEARPSVRPHQGRVAEALHLLPDINGETLQVHSTQGIGREGMFKKSEKQKKKTNAFHALQVI
jgi:hypothetical protein